MQTLDQQLKSAFEGVKRKEKITIHLKNLVKLIAQKEKLIVELAKEVKKEEFDEKKLEKLNVRSLFHKVLGSKETELEKERQEYLSAFMRHHGEQKNLESLKFERTILEQQLSALFNVEVELKEVLLKKAEALKKELGSKGKQILLIEKNILSHQAKIKEIRQAIPNRNTPSFPQRLHR